jgi:hypothetical protein
MKQKMIKNLKVNVSSSNVCWSFFILKTLHFILFSYQFSKTNFAGFSEQKERNKNRLLSCWFCIRVFHCYCYLLFPFALISVYCWQRQVMLYLQSRWFLLFVFRWMQS